MSNKETHLKKSTVAGIASALAGVTLVAAGLLNNDTDQIAAGAGMLGVAGGFVVFIVKTLLNKGQLLEESTTEKKE